MHVRPTDLYWYQELSKEQKVQLIMILLVSLIYLLLRFNVNTSSIFSAGDQVAVATDDKRAQKAPEKVDAITDDKKRSEEFMRKRILDRDHAAPNSNPLDFDFSSLERPLKLFSLPKESIHNIFSFLAKDNVLIRPYFNYLYEYVLFSMTIAWSRRNFRDSLSRTLKKHLLPLEIGITIMTLSSGHVRTS